MNRIKIKPDFYAKFTGNVTYPDGSEVQSAPLHENEDKIKNDLIELVEYNTGERYISKLKGIEVDGKKFIARIPNPVFLLLNSAIDNYNQSEECLKTFVENSTQHSSVIYRLDNNLDGTSDVFNSFIQFKITSINSVINSTEIFINQKIPFDYCYNRIQNNKSQTLNKKEIEQGVSFREKVEILLPKIFPKKDFNEISPEIKNVLDAYLIRRETIHMKTHGKTLFDQYYEVMSKLIDADIKMFINSTITYMNFIQRNFIEFE